MAVSPDDRFAGLITSSAERGGWVPGDVFTADSEGEEEFVEPRRVRLPVLVALALATVGILIVAFILFRPAPQHASTGGETGTGQAGSGQADTGQDGAGEDGAGQTTDQAQAGQRETGQAGAQADGAEPSGEVVVHVTGAVRTPSVVTLDAGDRVQDAVEAAGGLLKSADPQSVNLARVVGDGEQIHIPAEGEEPAQGTDADAAGGTGTGENGAGGAAAGAGTGGAGNDGAEESAAAADAGTADAQGPPGAAGASGKVDLNSADAATLETLPGVGPVTAEAIIAHRQTQPFAAVDDLLLVKGIGPKTFDSLKDLVTVG